jgi:hypothetical protein
MTRPELHNHALSLLKSTLSLKETSTALAGLVLERKVGMKDVIAVMTTIGKSHKDLVNASQ